MTVNVDNRQPNPTDICHTYAFNLLCRRVDILFSIGTLGSFITLKYELSEKVHGSS